MKPINEIIQLSEYKRHIFKAACGYFECGDEQLPSLYLDGISNKLILYRLRNCKNIHTKVDELYITSIPTFLDELRNVDKSIYDSLMNIYNTMTKIADEYGINLSESLDPKEVFKAYDIENYSDMWANKEFKIQLRKDAAELKKRIDPIQEIANQL